MFLNFSKRRRKRQRQCYKTLSMSSPFDFTTVLFGQLWSYSVHSVHFDYLVYFGLIRSIFGLIHFTSVLFGHFGSIQSISVHSDHFHPIPSTSVFSHRTGTTYHFSQTGLLEHCWWDFYAVTYSVVPHFLGNTVAFILSCCFLSSMLLPLFIKKFHWRAIWLLSPSWSGMI